MTSQSLGSVLVVGGCGFLGHEIVHLLCKDPTCTVSVLSRDPREPRVDGVTYQACDISDLDSLRALVHRIRPQTIVNTASPIFFQDKIEETALYKVNVVGTQNLLDVANTTSSVRAFVHTSSTSVHGRSNIRLLTEDAPLVDRSSSSDDYAITKAAADTVVLKANCSGLQTLCLRLPVIYGERDNQFFPGSLAILRDGKTNIQLGDNTNLFDAVYVGNAALAHVLAIKTLLRAKEETRPAKGDAFFITDDAPMPFWDFQRKIWNEAGDRTPLEQVRVIPAWVGMAIAVFVEYVFWFFTFAQKLPPKSLRQDTLRYAITESTYCISKAKERLGYEPLTSTDEGIRRGVRWALRSQKDVVGKNQVPEAGAKDH